MKWRRGVSEEEMSAWRNHQRRNGEISLSMA
jgi:hypothetical protein